MMVVPVLMTSCHVSEKSKKGSLMAQTIITRNAEIEAMRLPVFRLIQPEMLLKRRALASFFGGIAFLPDGFCSFSYLFFLGGTQYILKRPGVTPA